MTGFRVHHAGMPGQAPVITDEREQLLAYLAQQRAVLKLTAHGLADDEARRPAAPPSPLTVGGLIKHVMTVERSWISDVLGEASTGDPDAYLENFRMGDDQRLEQLFAEYDDVARRTEDVVRSKDLDDPVPVPKGVPWFPPELEAWTVRWVLLHLMTETARHAGHADIVREAIDGATAFPLMAAAEGWPATEWLQPWQPAAG
jgi:uncharacterized damage-inducible protein DinB